MVAKCVCKVCGTEGELKDLVSVVVTRGGLNVANEDSGQVAFWMCEDCIETKLGGIDCL